MSAWNFIRVVCPSIYRSCTTVMPLICYQFLMSLTVCSDLCWTCRDVFEWIHMPWYNSSLRVAYNYVCFLYACQGILYSGPNWLDSAVHRLTSSEESFDCIVDGGNHTLAMRCLIRLEEPSICRHVEWKSFGSQKVLGDSILQPLWSSRKHSFASYSGSSLTQQSDEEGERNSIHGLQSSRQQSALGNRAKVKLQHTSAMESLWSKSPCCSRGHGFIKLDGKEESEPDRTIVAETAWVEDVNEGRNAPHITIEDRQRGGVAT